MAIITFKCKNCQQSIDAPAEAAGALGDCPNCQKEITVPLVSDPVPAPAPVAEAPAPVPVPVPVAVPAPAPTPVAEPVAPAPVAAAPVAAAPAQKGASGKFTVGSKKQAMRNGSSVGTAAAAPVPQAKKKAGKGGAIVALIIGVMIGYGAAAAQMLLGHGFGPKPGGGAGHQPVASTNVVPAAVAGVAPTNSGAPPVIE